MIGFCYLCAKTQVIVMVNMVWCKVILKKEKQLKKLLYVRQKKKPEWKLLRKICILAKSVMIYPIVLIYNLFFAVINGWERLKIWSLISVAGLNGLIKINCKRPNTITMPMANAINARPTVNRMPRKRLKRMDL